MSGQETAPKLLDQVAVLRDVWKSYSEGEYVLRGLDLAVERGDYVSIHGRSGSGKSTLLKLIGLLDRPNRGEVRVLGKRADTMGDAEAARIRLRDIGFIFQALNLIPHITVVENIEVPLWLGGEKKKERKSRALELLKQFEMERLADRYPNELSAGEQQRVAAIRAVVNRPSVVIADEPTAHLDDENAALLMEMLSRLNREMGVTLVVSTTSEGEARSARTVYELFNGKLRQA